MTPLRRLFRFVARKRRRLLFIACLFIIAVQVVYISLSVPEDSSNDVLAIEPFTRIRKPCKRVAPREGVIVLNTLGLLANNLFEVAYANRLAAELCWDVVLYRPLWNNELPSSKGLHCFPNAMLPQNYRDLSRSRLSNSLQKKLGLNIDRWDKITEGRNGNVEYNDDFLQLTEKSTALYFEWVKELEQKGVAVRLENLKFDFTGNNTDVLIKQIRGDKSKIRMVSLEAFFIHFDWMAPWIGEIRHWLTISNSCCHSRPPEDAVVIHVRDFDNKDDGGGIEATVYTQILNHYNLTNRPLWIVCQPKSANSTYVQEIVNSTPNKVATIVTGRDQYDALCTLTRSKTLLLSAASSFSQMGAMLSDPNVRVHMPVPTLNKPRVTLLVPTWKYHLVAKSRDRIERFDVPHDNLHVKMG